MSLEDGRENHQIIIVRRGHGDEDEGHHGGVWKIAFADFMTAMMCFFLVMWLINAADEDTRESLASYFNPVKLVDRTTGQQGLNDPDSNAIGPTAGNPVSGNRSEQEEAKNGSSEAVDALKSADAQEHSDKNLFADPYAVLAEIAAETGKMQNISAKGDGGAQDAGPATGASGGEAYRDPFAPDFWSQQVVTEQAPEDPAIEPLDAPSVSPQSPSSALAGGQADTAPEAKETAGAPDADAMDPGSVQSEPSASNVAAAGEIEKELSAAFEKGDKLYEGLSVTATEAGVRISITDQLDFGMFEIGSAVPRRELVLAMEKIGKTLSTRPGKILIQGHTDARPFRSEAYDNWRLSTARAHSAYYMLVRGGLDEQRIVEVSGFADRELKLPNEPLAAANRRIEIILEAGE